MLRPIIQCARKTGQISKLSLPGKGSRIFSSSTRHQDVEPFRKHLKDVAKERRLQARASSKDTPPNLSSADKWELTVGLEIHAQLNTERKLFSEARTSLADTPNSHVAVFDAALPGAQPQFQAATLVPAINAALALNSDVEHKSSFDRKHYFYHDQPNGYQITQYYHPFAKGGFVDLWDHDGIAPQDGKHKRIHIKQIQMEQDTAKSLVSVDAHLVDLNRVSHPLIEIITYPDFHHAKTAAAFVRKVQAILSSVQACVIGMDMGGLRADVNVSVRKRTTNNGTREQESPLGQRTEIKNLISFAAIENAIEAEKSRQISLLEADRVVKGETRGWTIGSTTTSRLRSKEGEVDYRYMPDPDIPPLFIGADAVEMMRAELPMTPDEWLEKLIKDPAHKLTLADAKALIELDQGARLQYFVDVVNILDSVGHKTPKAGKLVGNWILQELGRLFSSAQMAWDSEIVGPQDLGDLLAQLVGKRITSTTARHVLALKFDGDARSIKAILDKDGLWLQQLSESEYAAWAREVIAENPDVVQAIRSQPKADGKVQYLVGQMLRKDSEGRCEPVKAREAILLALPS